MKTTLYASEVPYGDVVDKLGSVSQTIPVGVSGALIMGMSLNDWILIGTALLLILNLTAAGMRFYQEVIKRANRR